MPDRPHPDRHNPPTLPDADGLAQQAWFESMASLAWLQERRLAQLGKAGGRAHLECLRLRAIVALMWWERLLPQALSCWSMSDAERLVVSEAERLLVGVEGAAEVKTFGEQGEGLSSLLVRGPARAVLDWIEAAGIGGGPVFRRIRPDGLVRTGALTPVGIASLFSILLMEGRTLGVVDRQFSLDVSTMGPTASRMRHGSPPAGRGGGRGREGRSTALGGQAPVHPNGLGWHGAPDLV